MSLSQLQQIGDIPFQVDSPANAANGVGIVYIPDIEVNRDYIGTLDFYIYDLNADTDPYTGEPYLVTQGTTSVSREGEQFYIYVQRELNLLAAGDASLSLEIQFQDQSDPLQPNFVISESLSLNEQLDLFQAPPRSTQRSHQKRNHGVTPTIDPNAGGVTPTIDPGSTGGVDPNVGGVTPTITPPPLIPVVGPVVGPAPDAEALAAALRAEAEAQRIRDEESLAAALAEQQAAELAAQQYAAAKRQREFEAEQARLAEERRLQEETDRLEREEEAKRLASLAALKKQQEDRIASGIVFDSDDYDIPPPNVGTDSIEDPLGKLFAQSTKEIEALIEGKSPADSKDLFINYTDSFNQGRNFYNNENDISKLKLVRNPSFWGINIKGVTGISPYYIDSEEAVPGKAGGEGFWNTLKHGVALTPKHVLISGHVSKVRPGKDKILFVTLDNRIIERNVIGRATSYRGRDVTMDFDLMLLDEDLPEEIEILKTYPSDIVEEIPNSKLEYVRQGNTTYTNEYKYPIDDETSDLGSTVFGRRRTGSLAWATNQQETSSIFKLDTVTFDYGKPIGADLPFGGGDIFSKLQWVVNLTPNPVSQEWNTPLIPYDSSSPIMSVINNELVLASIATARVNGSFTGGKIGNSILNELITKVDTDAGISTGYTVTPYEPPNLDTSGEPLINKEPVTVDLNGNPINQEPEIDTGSTGGTDTNVGGEIPTDTGSTGGVDTGSTGGTDPNVDTGTSGEVDPNVGGEIPTDTGSTGGTDSEYTGEVDTGEVDTNVDGVTPTIIYNLQITNESDSNIIINGEELERNSKILTSTKNEFSFTVKSKERLESGTFELEAYYANILNPEAQSQKFETFNVSVEVTGDDNYGLIVVKGKLYDPFGDNNQEPEPETETGNTGGVDSGSTGGIVPGSTGGIVPGSTGGIVPGSTGVIPGGVTFPGPGNTGGVVTFPGPDTTGGIVPGSTGEIVPGTDICIIPGNTDGIDIGPTDIPTIDITDIPTIDITDIPTIDITGIPPYFTDLIIPGDDIPPPLRIPTPRIIPPPDLPFIPFIPADCGTPQVVRLGVPPKEDPEFVPPPIPEEPKEPEEVFLYPAPVNSFTAPFLSDIDFNTNFTKKEPTPFNFDEEVETTINEASVSAPNVKINLCEEEECSELGF